MRQGYTPKMETIGNFILVTLIWILVEVNCQGSISLDGVHVDPYALSEEERLLEYELQMKENRIHSKQFPKICHVCRVFVEELLAFLREKGEMIDGEEKVPSSNSGNIIYRAMNEVCYSMKDYRVTRIRPFRYVRGSTPLREMFAAAQKNSRVKSWMYNVPEAEIDDPTGEISLLESKCHEFVEKDEDKIVKWFFQNKRLDPIEWLCRKGKSKGHDFACLTESSQIKPDVMRRMIEKHGKRMAT